MEWELILQFNWENLFLLLSLLLGTVPFTICILPKLIKIPLLRFRIDIRKINNKINIIWFKFAPCFTFKIFIIIMKFTVKKDGEPKYFNYLPKDFV